MTRADIADFFLKAPCALKGARQQAFAEFADFYVVPPYSARTCVYTGETGKSPQSLQRIQATGDEQGTQGTRR